MHKYDVEQVQITAPAALHPQKVKVKVPPTQATKALRVGRGIALPNLRPQH